MRPQRQIYTTAGILKDANGDERPDGPPVGDCWRTCVASILDMDTADLPHFVDIQMRNLDSTGQLVDDAYDAIALTQAWLAERGWMLKLYMYTEEKDYNLWPETDVEMWHQAIVGWTIHQWAIFCGKSPRGDYLHAVVGDVHTMTVASDPHPSDGGIENLVEVWHMRPLMNE